MIKKGEPSMTDNVFPMTTAPAQKTGGGNGGGDGGNLNARVSSLEAQLQHLATKEDIRRLETLIAQREASLQRWLIGIVASATVTLAVALIRLFGVS